MIFIPLIPEHLIQEVNKTPMHARSMINKATKSVGVTMLSLIEVIIYSFITEYTEQCVLISIHVMGSLQHQTKQVFD